MMIIIIIKVRNKINYEWALFGFMYNGYYGENLKWPVLCVCVYVYK